MLGTLMKIAVGLIALPFSAYAGFIDDYGHWSQLSNEQKRSYAKGMWDYASQAAANEEDSLLVMGLNKCSIGIHLNDQMLVDAIDDYYKNNKNKLDQGITYVFVNSINRDVCRKYIDNERVKAGLTPLP